MSPITWAQWDLLCNAAVSVWPIVAADAVEADRHILRARVAAALQMSKLVDDDTE